MEAFLHSMTYPFLACLIVTGIHVYLGIHVIARKVIFVDLALATIAALGAVWGALLGWDIAEDTWAIKGFSLVFTFVGAAVFSVTRVRHERVPHEAIIGITYAVALAAILLASTKLPHGAEEVRDLQAGSILWVSGATIVETGLFYAVIGAFHYVFRARFLLLSLDPERAEAEGMNVRLWDFLFYVSLGFVVTSSVSIAGVLLVFSYLVIPAVVAVLFADGIGTRLLVGWTVGTVVSLAGVSTSYFYDLPSGPTIVVLFGGFLGLAGIVHFVHRSARPGAAALRAGAGAVVLAGFVGGSLLLQKDEHPAVAHLLEAGVKGERIMALLQVEADPVLWRDLEPLVPTLLTDADLEVRTKLLHMLADHGPGPHLDAVHGLLTDADDLVREEALECLVSIADPRSAPPILAAARDEEDEYLVVEMAEAAIHLGAMEGVDLLLDVMEGAEATQAREDAYEHLQAHLESDLTYHAAGEASHRAAEVAALRHAWENTGDPRSPAPRHP